MQLPVAHLRWSGCATEWVQVGHRQLRLDPDNYIVLDGAPTGRRAAALGGVEFAFTATLLPRSGAITSLLGARSAAPERGDTPDCVALLHAALLDADRALAAREGAMQAAKPATRLALLRRVLLASDFIQSHYDEPIALDDIARAARLSRFHLVRLFQRVHGLTPHAYLTRKRLAAAHRLLADPSAPSRSDVAARCGLGTRSSLFRHLKQERPCPICV